MGDSTTYIYSDRVWFDGGLLPLTIVIEHGQIIDLLPVKYPKAVDYGNNIIMPGVIDAHVHINEPGRTEWEGFDTATTTAALGGTTLLVDMPLNSSPVVTNLKALNDKLSAAQSKLHVHCGFWGGGIGQDISDVKDLLDAGCLGIKVFLSDCGLEEFPKISIADLSLLMSSIKKYDVPVLAHCELDTLPADSDINNNPTSYSAYLASRPPAWEHEAIKALQKLSNEHQCQAHVVHLATEEIIPWIINQKTINPYFTVETCPHYLLFSAEDISNGATLLKCAPPIRNEKTRLGLIQGLRSGAIDFIASDHSPALPELKQIKSGDFNKAWGGISGLQFLLSASWTALKDDVALEQFIPMLTEKPARFLGLDDRYGHIKLGYPANLCVWNPDLKFFVTENIIAHKHKTTPYLNRELSGTVLATYIDGQCVMKDGKLINSNQGQLVIKKNTINQ